MRIRPAHDDDAEAIASINVRAWRTAYRGLMDDRYLDSLSIEERARGWAGWMRERPPTVRIWVAEEDGAAVGYASVGPSRDPAPEPGMGELYAIYVEPSLVGTGRGRALLAHAVEDLRSEGYVRAELWMLRGNDRAGRVYERAGWRSDGTEKIELFDGFPVPEVRYRLDL
jgi:GNAT superfamily N-acetyltransferase